MGWQNPQIPWRELERRLSGRPAPIARRAPGGRRRRLPRLVAQAAELRADPAAQHRPAARAYAELHAHSSFSFLDGASSPEELAEEAVRLGLESLTLTDHDGVYGVVRFAEAAEALGLPTAFGAELSLDVPLPATQAERMVAARVGTPDPPGSHLLALARDPDGYAGLCRAISTAQLRGGAKGRPGLRPRRAHRRRRRALAGPHRLPQGIGARRPSNSSAAPSRSTRHGAHSPN